MTDLKTFSVSHPMSKHTLSISLNQQKLGDQFASLLYNGGICHFMSLLTVIPYIVTLKWGNWFILHHFEAN